MGDVEAWLKGLGLEQYAEAFARNDVDGDTFTVNIIPHTLEATTFGEATEGTHLNFEVDIVARYVERLGQS